MEDSLVEASEGTHKYYHFTKKSLQFLVLVSFFSVMYSYFSGYPLFFYYNLQFSTLIIPLFAQALDRNYMFLVCNVILAFLAKNVKFSYSNMNLTADDGVEKIIELPPAVKEAAVQENTASMEYPGDPPDVVIEDKTEMQEQQEQAGGDFDRKTTGFVLESADWEYQGNDEEEDDDEVEESRSLGTTEQVTDARVSTEELNKKFEEFIRKMKEEIRVEAQQPLITV